jgi:hypothetical protein
MILLAGASHLLCACGSGRPDATAPKSSATIAANATPPASSAAAISSADVQQTNTESTLRDHVDEAKAAQELKTDFPKLLQIAALSPKTHKNLLKNYLWKATGECPATTLVEVTPVPGVLTGKSTVKVHAKVYEKLKTVGARATQRGMGIEVVSGYQSVKEALDEWNQAIIDASLRAIKAAPPADQKEKSFAAEAKAAIGDDRNPKEWNKGVCDVGRLGGWTVQVQLVTVTAGGAKAQVLVKGGPEGDRFSKDAFESIYWDKPKGKNYRTLTELMSAGAFVRQCSLSSQFMTSPAQDSTWRCKEGTESWDPSNRPLPAWQ